MKKTITFTLIAAMLLATIGMTSVAAIRDDEISPLANDHVTTCNVTATSSGGRLNITMTVSGNGVQDKLGVSSVEISEKVGSSWSVKEVFTSDDEQDEFFDYGVRQYRGTTYYDGTVGKQYKITIYAVGQKGGSSGYMTKSTTITCK